jgi:HKD family nuclease
MEFDPSFITNSKPTHKETLLKLFEQAEEVIFAVGFLRKSGIDNISESLKALCADKQKKASFYIGTGFGETDPVALRSLHNIIKVKRHNKLVLCTPSAGIFHPKIYLFRKSNNVTIVLGSANLTENGWAVNDEVSIMTTTTIESTYYKQILDYFEKLDKKYFVEDILDLIENYKKQLNEYKGKNPCIPGFRFKRTSSTDIGIDMPMLIEYYKIYKQNEDYIEPKVREGEYKTAKHNLDQLASSMPLNKQQFHDLFGPLVRHAGYEKLWHSGSIHRKSHATLKSAEYRNSFRQLINVAKNNIKQPVNAAYDATIAFLNNKRKDKKISGIGENIVAEVLMTYDPTHFANLNKNPLAVLALVGKKFPSVSSFKGDDYKAYVELLTKIKNELGMCSLLEIDSFFNYVYWTEVE